MTGLIAGLTLAALTAQAQPQALTVEDAVKIALQNAFAVRLAESSAEQAKDNQKAASAALRPKITAGAQYIRLAQGVSNSFGGSGFGGSTSDSKQFNAQLAQLIDISGTTHRAVDAAKFQKLSRQMDVATQVNEIKNLVRGQFYQVLQSRALVKVQQDALGSAQLRLKNALLREAQGDVSHFDVLRLQTDAKRSEQALVDAENNYEIAKQTLNSFLGRPIETEFDPADVTGAMDVSMEAERALGVATKNRPEVRSGGYLVQSAESLVGVEQGALKPSLAFSTQYTRTIDPSPGQTVQSLFGVLTLSFTLSDSGLTRSRVNAAREVEKQAAIRLEQTKLAVSLDVRSALTRLESAKKAYEVAIAGQDFAKEALRLAQLRYDEGAGILLDVTTAQSDLTQAQGAAVTARYQYLSAVAALQRAVGTDDLTASAQEGESL